MKKKKEKEKSMKPIFGPLNDQQNLQNFICIVHIHIHIINIRNKRVKFPSFLRVLYFKR